MGEGDGAKRSIIVSMASSLSWARKLDFQWLSAPFGYAASSIALRSQYDIGPTVSMSGAANDLIGRAAAVPASSGPQWHITRAASFAPSGAWMRPAKTVNSSGSDAVTAR